MKSANTVKKVMIEGMYNLLTKSITEDQFLSTIKEVTQTKNKHQKSYWFRFFKGDTAATTVQDIERYLQHSTSNNKAYILNHFATAVMNSEDFQVYFS